MDIVIHPNAKKILIGIAIFVVIMVDLIIFRDAFYDGFATQTQKSTGDQLAAVDGVNAFYSLDYTEAPAVWIARVCARMTESGCKAARTFFAPSIRATVEKYRVQTGCSVEPIRLIEGKGNTRIWELRVILNNPWDGLKSASQDVYAEVAYENGKWLMNRILFEQEKVRFPTPSASQE